MADRGIRVQSSGSQGTQVQAMIGNINSPSVVSLASACSSDGSAESHVVEPEEMVALTQELKRLKEALGRLKKVFVNDVSTSSNVDNEKRKETRRVASHERLSEVLKILRQMLERYPMLQSNEIVGSAEHLIQQVKNFDYEESGYSYGAGTLNMATSIEAGGISSSLIAASTSAGHMAAPGMASAPNTHASSAGDPPREFHDAIEALAHVFSNRVSEYIMGDLESVSVSSTTSSKTKSSENLTGGVGHGSRGHSRGHTGIRGSSNAMHHHHSTADLENLGDSAPLVHESSGSDVLPTAFGSDGAASATDMLTADQIDAILMRHDQGVDHALMRAKIWSKYAKDLMSFVEKRTSLELEWARGLTKLAQTMRPVLKEESYLPFQSIYCTALDQDLEMCATTQSTCSLLHGYKFAEPLAARRAEHEKHRKALKERWQKELKRIQEAVTNLNKARALYKQRQQEYERCREALRIAEQGAEIGATGENKVDKRKRLEEEALAKKMESESNYRASVDEANERHRNLLIVKAEVLQQVRELVLQCDQTMKAVTVSYFHLQYTLTAPVPTQFQTLCESSRLYEPGFQFMEYAKRLPESQIPPQAHMVLQQIGNAPINNGTSVVAADPFHFEPYYSSADEQAAAGISFDGRYGGAFAGRRYKYSLETSVPSGISEDSTDGTRDYVQGSTNPSAFRRASNIDRFPGSGGASASSGGPMLAWTPSIGAIEPSDNESVESGKSSPSGGAGGHSPLNPPRSTSVPAEHQEVMNFEEYTSQRIPSTSVSNNIHTGGSDEITHPNTSSSTVTTSPAVGGNAGVTQSRRQLMSRAAVTHRFRKLKTPSKCRECDSYVYFQGYECHDCGLSSHKKCLETLALQCGHKRLPRRMTTFGVKLADHLQETGAQVPPLVCKCVHNIDTNGGIKVKGIYRVSGVKHKVEKLCQAFENGAELVDLTDINPNVVGNVLKLYMRQLPEPLLTFNLYPEFIRIAETYPARTSGGDDGGAKEKEAQLNGPQEEAVLSELLQLCRKLPRSHLFLLGFLMHHLHKVASEHESNNMTASNLAIVFGPTLLRRNEASATLTTVMETIHQARAVELLTIYVEEIFGPPEHVLPKDYHRYTTNRHPNPPHHVGGANRGIGGHPAAPKLSNRRAHQAFEQGSGGSGASGDGDIISSQQELRPHGTGIIGEEYTLPGHVVSGERAGGGSADDMDIFGASVSDEEDADPLPWDSKPLRGDDPILPDGSSKSKLSPLLAFHRGSHVGGGYVNRHASEPPPVIIKQSLKNFSGLEGVTSLTLSTQDSTEAASVARVNQPEAGIQKGSTTSALTSTNTTGATCSSLNDSSSLQVSTSLTAPKRSIQAEKSAPLASANYSNLSTNNTTAPPDMPTSSSSTLFTKVGRSTKKHSLDEDYLFAGVSASGVPHNSRLSIPPATTNAAGSVAFQGTLDISNYVDDSEDTTDSGSGTGSTNGGNRGVNCSPISALHGGRPSSYHRSHGGGKSNVVAGGSIQTLPPTAMTIASATEQRKNLSTSSSGTATIVNIEENKVKIQVPGLKQKSQPQQSSVVKQKSDKH